MAGFLISAVGVRNVRIKVLLWRTVTISLQKTGQHENRCRFSARFRYVAQNVTLSGSFNRFFSFTQQ
jgi:hypothetical protein